MTLGVRLSSSQFPEATKSSPTAAALGSFTCCAACCAMPRGRRQSPMVTIACFLALLRNLVDRYQGKEITNADFQQAIEEVLPRSLWFEDRKSLDWFFDGWVNGTAFPQFESEVKMARSAGAVECQRSYPAEIGAPGPGDQRSRLRRRRRGKDLSGPGLRGRRRDTIHLVRPGQREAVAARSLPDCVDCAAVSGQVTRELRRGWCNDRGQLSAITCGLVSAADLRRVQAPTENRGVLSLGEPQRFQPTRLPTPESDCREQVR